MENRISCKQMRLALQFHKHKPTKGLKEFLVERYAGTLTTLATEEFVGAAKNHKELKQCRKFRRPERCALLSGNFKVVQVAAGS